VTAGHVAASKRARVGDPHPRSPPAGVILQVPLDHEQTGLELARRKRFWILDFGFWIESIRRPRHCQSKGLLGLCVSTHEGAQFSVRTLEKGAHLRRNLRGFPRCALFETGAHLRRGCASSKKGAVAKRLPENCIHRQRSRAAFCLGSLLSPFSISCDSQKAQEIRRLRRFEFENLRHRRNLRIPLLTTNHADHAKDRRWFYAWRNYDN